MFTDVNWGDLTVHEPPEIDNVEHDGVRAVPPTGHTCQHTSSAHCDKPEYVVNVRATLHDQQHALTK
jgi:hypothetical protein